MEMAKPWLANKVYVALKTDCLNINRKLVTVSRRRTDEGFGDDDLIVDAVETAMGAVALLQEAIDHERGMRPAMKGDAQELFKKALKDVNYAIGDNKEFWGWFPLTIKTFKEIGIDFYEWLKR